MLLHTNCDGSCEVNPPNHTLLVQRKRLEDDIAEAKATIRERRRALEKLKLYLAREGGART
jgi:hypothetical protein